MKLRHTLLNLSLVLFFVVLSVMILEIGVRLLVPKEYWEFHDFTSDWQLDKVLGWTQKPYLDVTDHTDYGWVVRFQTNGDGVVPRAAQRQKPADKIRIMMVGDSTVVGRAVPQDKTISAQLEQSLQSQGIKAEVINAGVQGYGTDQSLLHLERLILLYKPDMVIYGLCQNDFAENQTSEFHGQAKPFFKVMPDGELVVQPPVLKEQIYSGGFGLRECVQSIAVYRLLQPGILKMRLMLSRWNKSQGRVRDDLDELYFNAEALESIDWNLFRHLLRRMDEVARENGASFLFYAHPALQEVWETYIKNIEQALNLKPGEYDRHAVEKKLTGIAQEGSMAFIPTIDWFWDHRCEGPFHLLPRDPHCNQNGYRLIAERLSAHCSRSAAQYAN